MMNLALNNISITNEPPRMDVGLALTYDAYDELQLRFPNILKQATEMKTKEHAVVLCWRNQPIDGLDDWQEFRSAVLKLPAIKYFLVIMGVDGYNMHTTNGTFPDHGIVIQLNIA